MKKFYSIIAGLLLFMAVHAQTISVQVCVNISGPQPNPNVPFIVSLTYSDSLSGVTAYMVDTIYNAQLPTTHCFAPFSFVLNPLGSFATGEVHLNTCSNNQSYYFSQVIFNDTTIYVSAQSCGINPLICTATLNPILGTTLLEASGTGTAPFQYSWDGGTTWSSNNQFNMPNASSGNYCVIIKDATGCTATDCYSPGSCDAYITASGFGLNAYSSGVAPFTYSWTTGDTTSSIITNTPGTYCVIITDGLGCSDSACYTIQGSQNCYTYIYPSGNYLVAYIDSTNTGMVNISWTLDGIPLNINTDTIIPNATGLYCVTIDYNGLCSASDCYNYNSGSTSNNCSVYAVAFLPDSANPSTYTFEAYPTGVPPFTYYWYFSDGTSSSLASPTITFPSIYGINWGFVEVTDSTGCVASYVITITTPNNPPNNSCFATFGTYSNYQFGNSGEVFFTPYALGSLVSYSWDFGDGSPVSTLSNPTHSYSSSGYYNVCLTVTGNGCTYTTCNLLYIDLSWWGANNPYQGSCTAGFVILSGNPAGSNSGLISMVNTSQGNNLSYTWSFGNGIVSNDPYPIIAINNPGVYEICLTIVDSLLNCSDTFCDTITIDSLGNVYRSSLPGNIGIIVLGAPQPNSLLGTQQIDNTDFLSIMPNPSEGLLSISCNKNEENIYIEVFDITGKRVYQQNINNHKQTHFTLDLHNLDNGTYLIKVVESNRVNTARVMISH
ncbi:MAG: PKD domain-containing protein [Bacteroidia bacterium]|nr:PKD domain-containing protein [Bacteroidia bacterium]MCZ2247507.1 PKD domain-containing protein [Bacteroidia bacterium]